MTPGFLGATLCCRTWTERCDSNRWVFLLSVAFILSPAGGAHKSPPPSRPTPTLASSWRPWTTTPDPWRQAAGTAFILEICSVCCPIASSTGWRPWVERTERTALQGTVSGASSWQPAGCVRRSQVFLLTHALMWASEGGRRTLVLSVRLSSGSNSVSVCSSETARTFLTPLIPAGIEPAAPKEESDRCVCGGAWVILGRINVE